MLRKSLIIVFGFFLIGSNQLDATTLEKKLNDVDKLRAGFNTPFDEVERRCNELLLEYTKPEEQAQIYFQLIQVEGQSGFQRPEKIAAYIEKALALPLDPSKEIRLYIYLGDAIQTTHRGVHDRALIDARREAAMPYLQGLRRTLDYDLPEEAPELPSVRNVKMDGPDTPEFREEYRVMRQKFQEQVQARKKAELQVQLIEYRDVLTSQVAFMYSRFPFATEELENLATNVLQDKAAVDRLISRVNKHIRERVETMPDQHEFGQFPADFTDLHLAEANVSTSDQLSPSLLMNPATVNNRSQISPNLGWRIFMVTAICITMTGIIVRRYRSFAIQRT